MRKFIDIVSKLTEGMFERLNSAYSVKGFNIYKNPSFMEFEMLRENATVYPLQDKMDYGCIRGLIDRTSGDLYIWDGFFATHGGIKDRYMLSGALHLLFPTYRDSVQLLTLWRYDDLTVEAAEILLKNNKALNRMFRNKPFIISIDR